MNSQDYSKQMNVGLVMFPPLSNPLIEVIYLCIAAFCTFLYSYWDGEKYFILGIVHNLHDNIT